MNQPSDWVTLIGHLAWPVTVVALCLIARNQLRQFVEAVAKRVADRQSHVTISRSGIEIKALEAANPQLGEVKPVHPVPEDKRPAGVEAAPGIAAELIAERDAIYKKNRGIFLVHQLEPPTARTQEYDLFIYILRHKSNDLSIVKNAEFFFGKSWGYRVFPGRQVGDVIGVRTSAYGTFLCVCRVTFTDGEVITLSRYIDFEMGKLVKKATELVPSAEPGTAADRGRL